MESKSLWQIILDFLIYLFNRKKMEDQAQKERLQNNKDELLSEYNSIDKQKEQKQEENRNADINKIKDRLNDRF